MRLVLIDGHAILHRAYHAYPPLSTAKGELIGAVYGFTNILLTVLEKLKPEYVVVAFDKKGPTFRHQKFKAYKIGRKPMPEELAAQLPRVHEVVAAFNIPVFEVEGYEADDVIGTLVEQAKALKVKNLEIIIVTGDQDALQLVEEKVKVYMPGRGKQPAQLFDPQSVRLKYGVAPEQIIVLKALAGDASDGIPGVKGIGDKTAAQLINQYQTLENIYRHLKFLPPVLAQKLKIDRQNAYLSRELATIDKQVPIKLVLTDCCLKDYDKQKVLNLFEELEFKSLLKKLPENGWEKQLEEVFSERKSLKEKIKTGKQMELFNG
jgi:DNA polymerase-1